ncbi:hypothetical protein ASZ90_014035 [hydrocarbon metagenome]|uniref:Uncharacterized protein n=1 Tax=hydrocarbon metagenome TaxID=938273 RepID=A0A0W8F666_9ZZZZ
MFPSYRIFFYCVSFIIHSPKKFDVYLKSGRFNFIQDIK